MKLALVSILAVASLSLAACEDKKPEPANAAATTTAAATRAAAAPKPSAAPGGWIGSSGRWGAHFERLRRSRSRSRR